MEFIKGIISGESGAVAQILVIMGIVNASLTGASLVLASFKDKTKTKVDDKAYAILHSVLKYAGVVIDFLQGNPEHKKPEAPKAP